MGPGFLGTPAPLPAQRIHISKRAAEYPLLQRKPDTAYKKEVIRFVHGLQPKTRSARIPARGTKPKESRLSQVPWLRQIKQALSEKGQHAQ